MATGVVGTLAGNATLSYTPAVDAKVSVAACSTSSGGVTANGVNIIYFGSVGNGAAAVFVGAGQTIVIGTSSSVSAIISSLESA